MEAIGRYFNKGIQNFSRGFKRFPETIFLITTLVIIGILSNHSVGDNNILGKLAMTVFLLGPWSANITLTSEKYNLEGRRLILQGILLVIGIGFYFIIPERETALFMSRYVALIIGGYLIFAMLPYFFKRDGFSKYVVGLILYFIVTYFFSGVFYGGINILLFSIEELFELNIDYLISFDLAMVIFGLFAVSFFLGIIPDKDEELVVSDVGGILSKFVMYIGLPLLWLYMLVIYAYLARILILWQWPKGVVGNLVLAYGALTILAQVAIEILDLDNKWINTFKTWFPRVFLVPWIMMIITISIRINAYGITVQRYMFIIIALIYGINTILRLIKYKYTSMALFSMAVVVLFLGTFGPFSAINISTWSQTNRLTEILNEHGMLDGNTIIINSELKAKQKEDIESILESLNSMDAFEQISYIPEGFDLWDMEEVFGFEYDYGYRSDRRHFHVNVESNGLIEVKNWDYIYALERSFGDEVIDEAKEYQWLYRDYNNTFVLVNKGIVIFEVDTSDVLKSYHEDLWNGNPMIKYEKELSQVTFELRIHQISGYEEVDVLEINSLSGYCLIKEK